MAVQQVDVQTDAPSPVARRARRALPWLIATTLVYAVMNGAQIFETLVIVPAWTAAPPESLALFQGPYGLDFRAFWIATHTVHELTFVAAVVACWRLPRIRNWLLVLLVVHSAVRAWTLLYFAPEIIEFQAIPPSDGVDPALLAEAGRWRDLNLVRVGIFVAVSFALLPLVRAVDRLRRP